MQARVLDATDEEKTVSAMTVHGYIPALTFLFAQG